MPKDKKKPKDKKNWVDFSAIKKSISMEMILERYGLEMKKSGNNLVSTCPIHKGSNSRQFSVDPQKNIWHCFGNCNTGGNILDFVAMMEIGSKDTDAIRKGALLLKEWFGIGGDTEIETPVKSGVKTRKKDKEKKTKPTAQKHDEPKVNKPLEFSLKKIQTDHPWLTERFTPDTIKHFGIGYNQGKGSLAGRVVIPIHDESGQLLAYAGRAINEEQAEEAKYKLPSNFFKSLCVFNLHRVPSDSKIIILVESFLSVFWLTQNGFKAVVALMGASISSEQTSALKTHFKGPQQHGILLLPDNDEAGMKCKASALDQLSPHFWVKAPDYSEYGKKPHHLSAEDLKKIIP